MTPIQCRMARAALCWKMQDLADRCHVSVATIVRLEQGGRNKTTPANLAAIRRAFEAEGITFIWEEGCAVGIKMRMAATYRSVDDLANTLIRPAGEAGWHGLIG